jgi:integrase
MPFSPSRRKTRCRIHSKYCSERFTFSLQTGLAIDLPYIDNIERAKQPERLPIVFTPEEVRRILNQLEGLPHLVASLLYGSGLRLGECLRLRVKFKKCWVTKT